MRKKKILTEQQIVEKVEYLRNQRDGITEGVYRNYLANLYMFLKERCDQSGAGYCNPYPSELLAAIGRSDLYKSYLGYEYCDDLEALGYIRMEGYGKEKKIYVIKPLDF